jgi:hypothetical protein
VLTAEASLRYRLASRLRRESSAQGDDSLEAREERVAAVRASLLGRLLGLGGSRESVVEARQAARGRPLPGPLLDREIDRALQMLAGIPFEEVQERGWHLQPNTPYTSLNDVPFLRENPELWMRRARPRGVRWRVDEQIELMGRLAGFAGELADVPDTWSGAPGEFAWDNGTFTGCDAFAYYGLVRDLAPRRVVEIGAGASTLLLARAAGRNDVAPSVTVVEPYPRWNVLGKLPAGWTLHEELLQAVDLATFEDLEAGDILFYDGSHCARTASDVNWMLFEVLPRLTPGVWIHFHDIFWPHDYPPEWILNEGLSWNEQYLLQAFLMHNSAYRPRLALAMLLRDRRREMAALLPHPYIGASVWIEKSDR